MVVQVSDAYSGPQAPDIRIQTCRYLQFDPAADSDRGPPPRWPAGADADIGC
jgi:hypothetical protein